VSTPPTPATAVRYPGRGRYDRADVDAVLDDGFLAHVGLVADDGRPVVVPMLYARIGDEVVLHGSPATRLVRALKAGADVCVTVTHLDALVLARSAFHHSVNYRSVVVLGRARFVDDLVERAAALEAITERVVPGRLGHLRPMTDKEVRGTAVLAVPLTEASAKVRTGPPIDDDEDYELPIWGGTLPVTSGFGEPTGDGRNLAGVEIPAHVRAMVGPRVQG
jgi:nitroimidazol reductase NimA-like FMN-containing flavoprotein (pyridoxamine 5'-phosphate oxidase superfamily)